VPWIVALPCGPENRVCIGIVHMTVLFDGPAFAAVSVIGSGAPPVGVNVKVRSNFVGINTDVLPIT
jgi:hypothetical protein